MEIVEDAVIETNENQPDTVSNSAAILDALIPDTTDSETEQAAQGVALVKASAVESLAGLLSLIGIVSEFRGYMRVATVWNGEACHELAAKLVPVFLKYSWGQRLINLLNTGGGIEELALFPVAMAMIAATYQAYQADSAAMKPKNAAAVDSEEMEPGKVYTADTPLGSTVTVKKQYED